MSFISKFFSDPKCLVFFVFNSDKISGEEYSVYAHEAFVKALSKALKPSGSIQSISIQGCHGDLLENPMTGGTPPTKKLESWIRTGNHGINADSLDGDFKAKLKSNQPLLFYPYVIGIDSLQKSSAVTINKSLRQDIGSEIYLGFFTLNSPSSPFQVIANDDLRMGIEMKIDSGKFYGYVVRDETLKEIGLQKGQDN